jgi:hypothetical protein
MPRRLGLADVERRFRPGGLNMSARWLAFVAFALAGPLACAEEAAPTPPSMPELSVESQRERLHALREALFDLEDQFFTEYNKVNDVWYFQVRCSRDERNLASMHNCRPVFLEWAQRDEALRWWDPAVGAAALNDLRLRTPAYQKHLVEVVSRNPALLKLLQQRDETRKNYNALYTEMHKDKFWVWD